MRERKIMGLTSEMLEPYREYLMDEKRSWTTVEEHLRDVRKSLKYLGDDGGVDKEKVRGFKMELMEHYRISSVNSMLAAVNSFLGFVGREDLKVKLLKVQKAVYSRPGGEMTEREYEGLVRTAKRPGDLRISMLLQTIDSTGTRISELEFIIVESLETGRAEIYNKGKSRVVLLPVELTRLLKKCCRRAGIRTGGISITRQGSPLGRNNVSKKIKQLARATGVDVAKVFPHNFRHLFVRIFYNIEKDMVRLMGLLGYSSISTTRIYTMTTEEQLRRQISQTRLVLG